MTKSFAQVISVLSIGFLLSGCTLNLSQNKLNTPKPQPTIEDKASSDENPTKTITGTLSKTEKGFYLLTMDGQNIEVTSRKVDLQKYVNLGVTLIGQFSGTTLYVDEAK